MNYPSPCDNCEKPTVCTMRMGCSERKIRYLYRQKQINAYAKKHGVAPTTKPMLSTENPCLRCGQNDFCGRICPARAVWWDVCMEKLRGRLGL